MHSIEAIQATQADLIVVYTDEKSHQTFRRVVSVIFYQVNFQTQKTP